LIEDDNKTYDEKIIILNNYSDNLTNWFVYYFNLIYNYIYNEHKGIQELYITQRVW
jgi:hypothetical protein